MLIDFKAIIITHSYNEVSIHLGYLEIASIIIEYT